MLHLTRAPRQGPLKAGAIERNADVEGTRSAAETRRETLTQRAAEFERPSRRQSPAWQQSWDRGGKHAEPNYQIHRARKWRLFGKPAYTVNYPSNQNVTVTNSCKLCQPVTPQGFSVPRASRTLKYLLKKYSMVCRLLDNYCW